MAIRVSAVAALSFAVSRPSLVLGYPPLPASLGSYFFVPSHVADGGAPNTLSFTETFDTYPVGYYFAAPTNGWVSEAGDSSTIMPVAGLPVTPVAPSQFSGNCLKVETEGQTLCNVTTGVVQNVWVDLSVLMVPCEDLPGEDMISGHQLGFCLDAENRFNVYCGLTNGFLASDVQFASYPGQTARVTVQIAYDAQELNAPFFRVSIDQTNIIWNVGYPLPWSPTASGGAWLPCVTPNRIFAGFAVVGNACIDNLSHSDSYVGGDQPFRVGITPGRGVFWQSDYGRRYQVETCEDLSCGEWQPLGEPVLGDGTTKTVSDTDCSATQKFYRVTPL